jgi:hypothetical protein
VSGAGDRGRSRREWGRIRRSILAAVLVAAGTAAGSVSSAAAARGYRIQQRSGESLSVIVLSSAGARFELLQPPRHGGRTSGAKRTTLVATILDYLDGRQLLLDPVHRLYTEVPIAHAIAGYEKEVANLKKAWPAIKIPTLAAAGAKKSAPLTMHIPAAHLRPAGKTMRIGPVLARAYTLHQGGLLERLWYSTALPLPPPSIRSLLARALRAPSAGAVGALGGLANEIPLRIEMRQGRRWSTVLVTTHLSVTTVGRRQLQAPPGYRLAAPVPTQTGKGAHKADVPANPIRCAFVITCIAGEFSSPISNEPGIWADYWGPHFAEHPDVIAAINHGLEDDTGDEFADPAAHIFWEPLSQYGVGKGKLLGDEIVGSSPGKAVGSDGVLEVVWFVLSHRWGTPAPKFWWRYWGESPIFAIFVDESEVDPSAWAGYHAFAFTEGVLWMWLVHAAMPFFVVKVPSLPALGNQKQGTRAWRETVDAATERASHEFVEAATDPYPFTAWGDPLKEPIWENGEIADICEQGNTFPWGKETRIAEQSVAVDAYWSNEASACVPEPRPHLRITAPSANTTIFWRSGIAFVAEATDTWDGVLEAEGNVRWIDEGRGQIGTGAVYSTNGLSPGVHHVFAEETDSTGGFAKTAPVTVNVVARAPVVQIEQPASGAKFASNHVIAFHGSATDPAQGSLDTTATWAVDGVPVGTGASLFLHRIPTEGEHIVTLTATNEVGLSTSASIHVEIGPPVEAPSVEITSPADHFSDIEAKPITFTAIGEGSGGEELPASAFVWTDEPDGPLGTGPSITKTLSGSLCEIVHHRVTVTVTDGHGLKASETIEGEVGDIC